MSWKIPISSGWDGRGSFCFLENRKIWSGEELLPMSSLCCAWRNPSLSWRIRVSPSLNTRRTQQPLSASTRNRHISQFETRTTAGCCGKNSDSARSNQAKWMNNWYRLDCQRSIFDALQNVQTRFLPTENKLLDFWIYISMGDVRSEMTGRIALGIPMFIPCFFLHPSIVTKPYESCDQNPAIEWCDNKGISKGLTSKRYPACFNQRCSGHPACQFSHVPFSIFVWEEIDKTPRISGKRTLTRFPCILMIFYDHVWEKTMPFAAPVISIFASPGARCEGSGTVSWRSNGWISGSF